MHMRSCRLVAFAAVVLLGACSTSDRTTPPAGAGPSAEASVGASGLSGGPSGSGQGGGGQGGGGQGGGGQAGVVKPCALITGADAATALGLPSPLTPTTDSDTACEYQVPDKVDSVAIGVETEPYEPGTEDIVVNMLGKDMAKKVAGLGQAALSYQADSQVQYHVWVNGKYLLIVVSKLDGGDLDSAAKKVATTAVSRL